MLVSAADRIGPKARVYNGPLNKLTLHQVHLASDIFPQPHQASDRDNDPGWDGTHRLGACSRADASFTGGHKTPQKSSEQRSPFIYSPFVDRRAKIDAGEDSSAGAPLWLAEEVASVRAQVSIPCDACCEALFNFSSGRTRRQHTYSFNTRTLI